MAKRKVPKVTAEQIPIPRRIERSPIESETVGRYLSKAGHKRREIQKRDTLAKKTRKRK